MNTAIAMVLLVAASVADGRDQPPDLREQAARMAALNPPPGTSKRPLGVGKVEGKSYCCGVFTVPQDWGAPGEARIDLGFAVARATGEAREPDPLVFLAGGPGQSALTAAVSAYDGVRPTRDIIRLDQRGAGTSQRLGVEECLVLALQDPKAEAGIGALLGAMQADAADKAGDASAPVPDGAVKGTVDRLCWDQFTGQGAST